MVPTPETRIILGLDPGLARLGYAVISYRKEELNALQYGLISTDSKDDDATRIEQLVLQVERIIEDFPITEAALEDIYFSRNVSSALSVAQVRGALILVLRRAGIPIVTFSPNTVKLSVCGNGRANKKEVARMSARRLGLQHIPKLADEADALAIAITASQRITMPFETV